MLEGKDFPEGTFLRLDARSLPKNLDPKVHDADSTDLEPFELPQLILKKSWQKKTGRFKAVITEGDSDTKGVVCSQSYVSIHLPIHLKDLIEAACLSYNSKLAVYYLLLTSGRFSSYRPESLVEEVLTVPVPRPVPGMLQNVNNYGDVDLNIREAFNFKDSEWALIDDLFNYTLPDFKGDNSSPGRQKTGIRVNEQAEQYSEPILQSYCECFIRVMKAGFGYEKQIGATIFREKNTSTLPLRLVAFYLNREPEVNVQVEHIDSDDLLSRLVELNDNWLKNKKTDRGDVFYQRVARLYASTNFNGHRVPTIYLIKPDQRRYWTCSTALRDADEVAADLMLWRAEVRTESDLVQELGHG
jgi:hypothetical protein